MFGYIKVDSPELKVKELEFYRGTYCGLCRAMGKCTGQCSRMTLSYDFAFLALCRIALEHTPVCFEQKRCLVHPIKKRNSMKRNAVLNYCAGAAALLHYHRLADDLADEKGVKRLRAALAKPFASHWRKKTMRHGFSELDKKVADGLDRLAALERQAPKSVNEPAAIFGEILADIMAFDLPPAESRIAAALGRSVGRWIYIADALDDAEEDAKKNRYNPFLLLYGGVPTKDERRGIEIALKNELFEAEAAMDLVSVENAMVKNIIYNILYLGMPGRIEQIDRESEARNKKIEAKRKKKRKDGQSNDGSV